MQQVKTLLASTQKDKVELANQLEEEKRYASHITMATSRPHMLLAVTSVMFTLFCVYLSDDLNIYSVHM